MRRYGNAVPDFFLTALGYLLCVWLTHGLLRAFLLFRSDAYGMPFVGKPDWYIFHGISLDLLWLLKYSGVFLLLLLFLNWGKKRNLGKAILIFLIGAHSFLLTFTLVDHETYRFLGSHLTPTLWSTYGNAASIREIFIYLEADLSVKYLPYVLFFGAVPFSLLLFSILRRKAAWANGYGHRYIAIIIVGASSTLAWGYLNIWKGGARESKLKPAIEIWREALTAPPPKSVTDIQVKQWAAAYQNAWLKQNGYPDVAFPNPRFPYLKTPLYLACNDTAFRDSACFADKDADGFRAENDCDDQDARVYPGAAEVPGNGVDEDCSGMDEKPWNIVFILFESHRGVNAGFMKPYGAFADGTPFLNKLADSAYIWTNFMAAGIPTIEALIAIHLSILTHPAKHIATEFTGLKQKAFTSVLADHGYLTRFFSAADPAWDNQTPWLRQWYEDHYYHRSRENDKLMFAHMAKWMRDSLSADKPFFLCAVTKTNHYPFNPVQGMKGYPDKGSPLEKMEHTMTYAESEFESLMHSIKNQEWYANTLFIISADHGFPLGEHGASTVGWGLYTENVWLPFLIVGNHPELGPDRVHSFPAGQLDIGPTILDLAGIRVPNHYTGSSLLKLENASYRSALCLRWEQGLLVKNGFSLHGPIGQVPRIQGNELFDIRQDRLEKNNLMGSHARLFDSLMPELRNRANLNSYLVEKNLIWP